VLTTHPSQQLKSYNEAGTTEAAKATTWEVGHVSVHGTGIACPALPDIISTKAPQRMSYNFI